LRNSGYHINYSDRIIVRYTDLGIKLGSKFYPIGSNNAHASTFCIRKFPNVHTCLPHGEETKVSIDWVACQSEQAVRTDPNTCVDTLIDNANLTFGMQVPRSKISGGNHLMFSLKIRRHSTLDLQTICSYS
jgi:hypothetical protein